MRLSVVVEHARNGYWRPARPKATRCYYNAVRLEILFCLSPAFWQARFPKAIQF